MNHKYAPIFLSVLLSVVLSVGCSADASSEDADATPIPPVIETSNIVSAEAFVVPITKADLAFEAGGRVVEIFVEEGQLVEEGAMLARLREADAAAMVASAQAAVDQAQASYDDLENGPTAEQIAISEAAVERAKASLADIEAGATEEDIAMAEAALARAETNLAQTLAGPTTEEIAISQARVNTLQAQLNQVASGTREEQLRASAAQLKQAEANVALAQTDYDKVAYAADSAIAQPIALALQQATLQHEAALANHETALNGATTQEVAIVRSQLAEGQAALNQLLAGATEEQIALAQISVLEAEAALSKTINGATKQQLDISRAGLKEAEAALAQLLAGATPEQLVAAEATVRQAQAGLDQAIEAAHRLELKAPFAGTITSIDLEVGQTVGMGTPLVSMADLSSWVIETDDLTEIDVVKVVGGQTASIKFDALPEEAFLGRVSRIKPRSEIKAGDVTYTVTMELDNYNDPRLRWGMTAFVEISTE